MRLLLTCLLACTAPVCVHAQSHPQGIAPALPVIQMDEEVLELETMTVTGVQPGPGLWKVRHGDHLLVLFDRKMVGRPTCAGRHRSRLFQSGEELVAEAGVILT